LQSSLWLMQAIHAVKTPRVFCLKKKNVLKLYKLIPYSNINMSLELQTFTELSWLNLSILFILIFSSQAPKFIKFFSLKMGNVLYANYTSMKLLNCILREFSTMLT
jgi:hypothetical protein